ncbi:MAG: hypothetical protein QXK49_02475 [Candidatus Aenigmatarchaeota archaeon]
MFNNNLVEKLKNLKVEFDATIQYLKEEFNLNEREILHFYAAEDIVNNPDYINSRFALEKMKLVGYPIAGLISFCGSGSPLHICTKVKNDKILYDYKPACQFTVITPSLPKENKEIKYGFICCERPFEAEEIKWGLIGKIDKFDDFCNLQFKDQCSIKRFPSKISPTTNEEIVNEFKKYLISKNKNYAKYGEKIAKSLEPLLEEYQINTDQFILNLLKRTQIGDKGTYIS